MSSYFKSMFKRWSGSQNQSGRLTYAPAEVYSADQPPARNPARPESSSGQDDGQSMDLPADTAFKEDRAIEDARTRAEQEELMMALGLSQSLHERATQQQTEGEDGEEEMAFGLQSMSSVVLPSPVMGGAAEKLSLKYWKDGTLGSDDQLCGGFYDVNGEFPELGPAEVFPDYEFLSRFEPEISDPREVVVVNPEQDPGLSRIEQQATEAFFATCPRGMLAGAAAIARVVADVMGGPADDEFLHPAWASASMQLKWELNEGRPAGGALLVPLGSICPGLSRHRALLFKYLADLLCIPCRLLRQRSNAFSDGFQAMVILEIDGDELLLDLMSQPGAVVPAVHEEAFDGDCAILPGTGTPHGGGSSSFTGSLGQKHDPLPASVPGTGPSSIPAQSYITTAHGMAYSPRTRQDDVLSNAGSENDGPVELSDADLVTISSSHRDQAGACTTSRGTGAAAPRNPGHYLRHSQSVPSAIVTHNRQESQDLIDLQSPVPSSSARPPPFRHSDSFPTVLEQAEYLPTVRPLSPLRNRSPPRQAEQSLSARTAFPPQPTSSQRVVPYDPEEHGHAGLPQDAIERSSEEDTSSDDEDSESDLVESTPGVRVWDPITDCLIDMDEVSVIQRLGRGSYGEVYRAEWQGTEVAVKQFLEQDMTDAIQEEFLQEVRIMKDLRHPNIVQFMGATWKPRGIVMQYMHRGSLFQLLHRNSKGKKLHLHRRLRMALDVALGLRYLHSRKPMIVHRDLKSPNLLVSKDWTVRLCDFGLSKLKSNTFLSTRSTGGTPEWMAPEILRTEASNEKSDVYSFAVIMWELMFYKEPWQGTKPMQVQVACSVSQSPEL